MTRYRRLAVALTVAMVAHAAWLAWQPARRLPQPPLQVHLQPAPKSENVAVAAPSILESTAQSAATPSPQKAPKTPEKISTPKTTSPAGSPPAPTAVPQIRLNPDNGVTAPELHANPAAGSVTAGTPPGTLQANTGGPAPSSGETATHADTQRPRVKTQPRFSLPEFESGGSDSLFVDVQLDIDAAGNVQGVTVVKSSGNRELDNIVRRGLRRYTFWPAEENGRPVSTTMVYRYRTNLKDEAW